LWPLCTLHVNIKSFHEVPSCYVWPNTHATTSILPFAISTSNESIYTCQGRSPSTSTTSTPFPFTKVDITNSLFNNISQTPVYLNPSLPKFISMCWHTNCGISFRMRPRTGQEHLPSFLHNWNPSLCLDKGLWFYKGTTNPFCTYKTYQEVKSLKSRTGQNNTTYPLVGL
jgi:hypothetical protein